MQAGFQLKRPILQPTNLYLLKQPQPLILKPFQIPTTNQMKSPSYMNNSMSVQTNGMTTAQNSFAQQQQVNNNEYQNYNYNGQQLQHGLRNTQIQQQIQQLYPNNYEQIQQNNVNQVDLYNRQFQPQPQPQPQLQYQFQPQENNMIMLQNSALNSSMYECESNQFKTPSYNIPMQMNQQSYVNNNNSNPIYETNKFEYPTLATTNENYNSSDNTAFITNMNVEDVSRQSMVDLMQKIHGNLTNQQLSTIFCILKSNHLHIGQQTDSQIGNNQVQLKQKEYDEYLHKRCLELKIRNQSLIARMLNVKNKLVRASVNSVVYDGEEEFQLLQAQIATIKLKIIDKLAYLRGNRLMHPETQIDKRKSKFKPLNVALPQLRDAVQIIDRELIRQRDEIRELIKYMYSQQI